jgi:hypothetical protein
MFDHCEGPVSGCAALGANPGAPFANGKGNDPRPMRGTLRYGCDAAYSGRTAMRECLADYYNCKRDCRRYS